MHTDEDCRDKMIEAYHEIRAKSLKENRRETSGNRSGDIKQSQ